jgi:hypothetical protein
MIGNGNKGKEVERAGLDLLEKQEVGEVVGRGGQRGSWVCGQKRLPVFSLCFIFVHI